MERIAQALLGEQQQAATGQRFAPPARKVAVGAAAGDAQPPFVQGPAARVIPFDQMASGQAKFCLGVVGSEGQRLLVTCRRVVELALVLQHVGQVVVHLGEAGRRAIAWRKRARASPSWP